jgi:hypothetical protein
VPGLIIFESRVVACERCGAPVRRGAPGLPDLDADVHPQGVTERYDAHGNVVGYMNAPYFDPHTCAPGGC